MNRTFLAFLKLASALFACALAGSGCEPPPPPMSPAHTFTGRIFIAQDNKEAIKLNMVTVKLMDAKNNIEDKRKQIIQEACEAIAQDHLNLDKLWQAKRVYDAARIAVDAAKTKGIGTEENEDAWKKFLTVSAEAKPKGRARILTERPESASTTREEASARDSVWVDRARQLEKAEKDLRSEAYSMRRRAYEALAAVPITRLSWGGAAESAVTDADGAFQLTIPAGKNCWLVAHAVVGKLGSEENYVWAFPVSAAYKNVQLHNKNTHPSICANDARTLMNRVDDFLADRDLQQYPLEKSSNKP